MPRILSLSFAANMLNDEMDGNLAQGSYDYDGGIARQDINDTVADEMYVRYGENGGAFSSYYIYWWYNFTPYNASTGDVEIVTEVTAYNHDNNSGGAPSGDIVGTLGCWMGTALNSSCFYAGLRYTGPVGSNPVTRYPQSARINTATGAFSQSALLSIAGRPDTQQFRVTRIGSSVTGWYRSTSADSWTSISNYSGATLGTITVGGVYFRMTKTLSTAARVQGRFAWVRSNLL
jgi:hypothetical protein